MTNDEIRKDAENVVWKIHALQYGSGSFDKRVDAVVELVTKDRERRDDKDNLKINTLSQIIRDTAWFIDDECPDIDAYVDGHCGLAEAVERAISKHDSLESMLVELAKDSKDFILNHCYGVGWYVTRNGKGYYSNNVDICRYPLGFKSPTEAVRAALDELRGEDDHCKQHLWEGGVCLKCNERKRDA